jgi:hypothetical protein
MTTFFAPLRSVAVSAAEIETTSPAGTAPDAGAAAPSPVPNPPAITERNRRFIARHMM